MNCVSSNPLIQLSFSTESNWASSLSFRSSSNDAFSVINPEAQLFDLIEALGTFDDTVTQWFFQRPPYRYLGWAASPSGTPPETFRQHLPQTRSHCPIFFVSPCWHLISKSLLRVQMSQSLLPVPAGAVPSRLALFNAFVAFVAAFFSFLRSTASFSILSSSSTEDRNLFSTIPLKESVLSLREYYP